MRPGAEGDALLRIAGDVEAVGLGKAGLVAIGRAEHEEHAVFRFEVDASIAPRRGDIWIGAIQRAYSSNTSIHFALPSRTSASCAGCVSSAQVVPAIASRGSFWPPEIASLMLARMLSMFWPEASSTLRIEVFGCFFTTGTMSPIAASMPD